MSKFIKLSLIHPNNVEGDGIVHLNVNHILSIVEASSMDRKHRADCNSIVYTSVGQYGVSEKASTIIENLQEISKELE